MSSQPLMFQVPECPVIVVSDGFECQMFNDRFDASGSSSMPPIQKAATIARLRALADVLSASP